MMRLPRSYPIMSFDLFDTVIVRKFRRPSTVFDEVELALIDEGYYASAFAQIRIDSELQARREGNFQREVTLEEIYGKIGRQKRYPATLCARAQSLELQVERQAIYAMPQMVEEIETLRSLGKQIVFATDIYLPKNFIESILTANNLLRPDDRLYVSSEIGKMKSTGDLFNHIIDDLSVDPGDICHVGDNFESDVRQAEERGLRTVYFEKTELNRYEVVQSSCRTSELILGAARLTKLLTPKDTRRNQAIWQTTANVSGPLMFCFANYCVQESLKKGLRSLYFLSRDGQILHKMAKMIVEKFYSDKLEVRYLYVSRQALLFPAMLEFNKKELDWIFAPTSYLSSRIVLKRINFTPEEFADDIHEAGLLRGYDVHLTPSEIDQLKSVLFKNEAKIIERAEEFRHRLIGYLKQEGLSSEKSIGVVDIGWSGSLQYALSKVLHSSGSPSEIHGYYFGVKRRNLFSQNDTASGWFTDYEAPRKLDKEVYIVPMTELFTAATHGGVDGYGHTDGVFHPILRSEVNEPGAKWGVHAQQAAMELLGQTLVESINSEGDLVNLSSDFLDCAEENYRKFLLDPSFDEAEAYCCYEDAEDQTEAYYSKLGEPFSFSELKEYFRSDFMHHHNEWRQGALRLSNQNLAKLAYSVVTTQ